MRKFKHPKCPSCGRFCKKDGPSLWYCVRHNYSFMVKAVT